MDIFFTFYHIVMVVALVGLFVNAWISRLVMPTTVARDALLNGEGSDELPFVSLLVPARNEERSIGECVNSLLAQDYRGRFEVIVLDDNSEDATASELAMIEDPRLRVLKGGPLPDGWAGKPWACHQLSETAGGEFLLFTDADTVHEPSMLSVAVVWAEKHRLALLSFWPRQVTRTWCERLVIPLLYVLGVGMLPHFCYAIWLRFPKSVRGVGPRISDALGAANGQFMFFRTEAYRAIGGHAAVKDHLVEDVALGRRTLLAAGMGVCGLVLNVDGRKLVRCRMYRSAAELWAGFSKNVRPVFEDRPVGFFVLGGANIALLVAPVIALPFFPTSPWLWAEVALIFAVRILLTVGFRTSWWSVVGHPVAYLIATAIGINSWWLSRRGAVIWKGRRYDPLG